LFELTTPRNGHGICFSRSTLAPLRILGGRAFRRAGAQIDFFGDGWATHFPEDIPEMVNVNIAMERSTMLLMGKSTISMAIFNSYVSLPEGTGIHMKYWYCII
jgi:hypothetical protein